VRNSRVRYFFGVVCALNARVVYVVHMLRFCVHKMRIVSPLFPGAQPIRPSAMLERPLKNRVVPGPAPWSADFSAWRASWASLRKPGAIGGDLVAALTVAAVALPLNLALAIACELPPVMGLVAGAIGGATAAFLGGAPLQVTGPAAALATMVLAVNRQFGPTGVAAAALVVGVTQLLVYGLRVSRHLAKLPEVVLAGFTTGVGLKILDQQIPEFLGFDYKLAELAKMMHRPHWLHEVSWHAAFCGIVVAFAVIALKPYKRFPAAIAGIALATFLASYLHWDIARVGNVPNRFPSPALPLVREDQWFDLIVAAVPLGLLAAIESLLSASAVDRMAGTKHSSDLEVFGQGVANLATSFVGGMPVSGVIVRSGVNVQSGGTTRLSSLLHGALLALAMLELSGPLAQVPLAALAGLLCVVGSRLIELRELAHLVRHRPVAAVAFALTAAGTVSGHLLSGLVAGLVVAVVDARLAGEGRVAAAKEALPEDVRAIVARAKAGARKRVHHAPITEVARWRRHVEADPLVPHTSYVHRQANVAGRVVLGRSVHVAAGSSVRADEGTPFFIGDDSNVQDGVVIHGLKDRHVLVGGEKWSVFVGRGVSMAHDALVHGPCFIGDHSFVGFKAVVHDSIVGARCFVGIGAVVVGVEIPDGKYVPHGAIVTTADAVAALPDVDAAKLHFNEDVVEVNRGLAAAYTIVEPNQAHDVSPEDDRTLHEAPWLAAGRRRNRSARF
jgi:sulfate permease, SulP family